MFYLHMWSLMDQSEFHEGQEVSWITLNLAGEVHFNRVCYPEKFARYIYMN